MRILLYWSLLLSRPSFTFKLEFMDNVNKSTRANVDLLTNAQAKVVVNGDVPNLLWRLYIKIVDYFERFHSWMTKSDFKVQILILMTLMILLLTYYFVMKLLKHEMSSYSAFEKSLSKSANRKQRHINFRQNNSNCNSTNNKDGVRLIELKAETYNGLIRLSKPGCRSIILICDADSGQTLLPLFRSVVRPYRRNKSLLFGYLLLEKNLAWYESLLSQAIGSSIDVRINPKKCISTVLSLNGFSKCFCVYHVKHIQRTPYEEEARSFLDEDASGADNSNSSSNHHYQGVSERVSFFAGLQSGDTTSASSETTSGQTGQIEGRDQEEAQTDLNRLLDSLPIWLDKMFDGVTRRYHIDFWPDNLR